jgi:hypothetical protein
MKNVRAIRGLALTSLASLGLMAVTPAFAESQFVTTGTPTIANARLNFQINVPRFLEFRVGSAGTTVDTVVFNVAAANVGNGTAVDGDITVGVLLRGNGGAISLTADTTADPLNSGADAIPFSAITTNLDAGTINAPVLADGASAPVVVPVSSGTRVTNRTATWSYDYANTAVVGAGTYAGQVVYTATMP